MHKYLKYVLRTIAEGCLKYFVSDERETNDTCTEYIVDDQRTFCLMLKHISHYKGLEMDGFTHMPPYIQMCRTDNKVGMESSSN